MSATTMKKATSMNRLLPLATAAAALLLTAAAQAAAPGILGSTLTTGPATFNLTAQPAYLSQPDGQAVYSWGYGCTTAPAAAAFVPAMANVTPFCNTMQVPGPTLVVTEGQVVTVTLTNGLPTAAGNTSILFPGFNVTTSCPASTTAGDPWQGLLTCEAVPGSTVTYTFTASSPGTRAYYRETRGALQVERGLYGAIIVLPKGAPTKGSCPTHNPAARVDTTTPPPQLVSGGESDFRLSS